ncbi:MAG: hypothetical protein GX413_13080 [Acetobacter sp.]|nr:hypothetical protein [Acetobacter sp.]
MNGLSDDIIRGCFKNPREIALDEAREEAYRAGYLKALEDVMENIPSCIETMTKEVIDQLRREYEKGTGDGKAE